MKTLQLAAAVICGAILILAMQAVSRSSEPESAPDSTSSEPSDLASRVAELEEQAKRARSAGPGLPSPATPPIRMERELPAGDDAEEQAEEPSEESIEAAREATDATREDAYRSGPAETDWTSEAKRTLLPTIEAYVPETSKLLSFDCRGDWCRLETSHDSVNSNNEFLLNLFAMERGGPLGTVTGGFRSGKIVKLHGGGQSHVIYIPRPGTTETLGSEP